MCMSKRDQFALLPLRRQARRLQVIRDIQRSDTVFAERAARVPFNSLPLNEMRIQDANRIGVCHNRRPTARKLLILNGEMSEWLKEHAWKACVGEILPRVRIPLSPPPPSRSRSVGGGSSRLAGRAATRLAPRQRDRIPLSATSPPPQGTRHTAVVTRFPARRYPAPSPDRSGVPAPAAGSLGCPRQSRTPRVVRTRRHACDSA